MAQPASVTAVIEDFQALSLNERLELLLEFSENLPELPPRYLEHPDLLERVEECQAPVYLFVEVSPDSHVGLFFSAPPEAPTTRGFASVLHEALNGLSTTEVLELDPLFPDSLGLTAAVSPLRMNGMRGMISRIKRQVKEKAA
mgnify:CR=1 FL=1